MLYSRGVRLTLHTCFRNINSYFVGQAGRLTKETREIRSHDEKNLGGENARASQLRALHT